MRFLQIVAMSVIVASLALSGAASAQSTNTIKGKNNAPLDQLFIRLKQAKDNGESRKSATQGRPIGIWPNGKYCSR